MLRDGIIFILILAACGGSKKEVQSAKHSRYDADFAVVYAAALEATRDLYPTLNDAPGPGKISTAWHQVLFGSTTDDTDMAQPTSIPNGGMGATGMSPASRAAGMPTRLTNKRYFVRFDVSVIGGRPWKVKVIGHASEWDPGAAYPVEMHGANRPPWLDGRIDSLQVAIYKRIKQYALESKDEEATKTAEDELPKTDPSTFAGVPAGAAKRLAELKDTLGKRDYAGLRAQLDDNVTWSLGGGTGADAALAMWQADPVQFDAMAGVIAAGCGGDNAKVRCPNADVKPGAWQLVLEPRGEAWRVTSFVKAE